MDDIALIFDLDGTLVDSLPDLRVALNGMLLGLGRRQLAASEVRVMIGDGTRALVQRALAATGPVAGLEEAHSAFFQFYETGLTRLTRLYPGVRESLADLRRSGARLGVCTNKSQVMTMAVLKAFEIEEYFSAVVGGDAVPLRKPNPAHLLTVVEQLGARPADAVMIGDGENDYAAARAVGIPVIMMSYGYLHVPRESLSPDAWLERFVEIPQTVTRIRAAGELKPVLS
jgi:phosphoglycolate phosphatase